MITTTRYFTLQWLAMHLLQEAFINNHIIYFSDAAEKLIWQNKMIHSFKASRV